MDYRGVMRRKLMEDIYNKMSDDEKRLFVKLSMQDKSRDEILHALAQQKSQLDRIEKSQNWVVDFGSDIAANLLTDSLIWLGSKLIKKF